jgi:DNA-directed RNA polymerase subunit N (RpoN/RPB10)
MKRSRWLSILVTAIALSGLALAWAGELRCSICGAVITDRDKYYQAQGGKEVYCAQCFARAPRCSICKLPTAPADIDPGTGTCPTCLAKLPRCNACGKPVIGAAYTFPSIPGIFCPSCKNNRPACYVCGAPVGDDHWDYPDGRITCGACGARAILEVSEIERIMRDARQMVEQQLGLRIKHTYELKVEKLSGLSSLGVSQSDKLFSGRSPLYGKELGMYRQVGNRSEIFLLFGLPPELLYETAAHEYTHAWQAENCAADLGPELREGFAQWVAAGVLRAKGYANALERLEARRDFPYGTGYQRLRGLPLRKILELLPPRR